MHSGTRYILLFFFYFFFALFTLVSVELKLSYAKHRLFVVERTQITLAMYDNVHHTRQSVRVGWAVVRRKSRRWLEQEI